MKHKQRIEPSAPVTWETMTTEQRVRGVDLLAPILPYEAKWIRRLKSYTMPTPEVVAQLADYINNNVKDKRPIRITIEVWDEEK